MQEVILMNKYWILSPPGCVAFRLFLGLSEPGSLAGTVAQGTRSFLPSTKFLVFVVPACCLFLRFSQVTGMIIKAELSGFRTTTW